MAHHVAPDGKIYVDTAFLNATNRVSELNIKHMGFGEFTLETPRGEAEFDRMRGKDFPGKSGRSHQFYDTKGGQKIAEWVIELMEKKGLSDRVAAATARVAERFKQQDKIATTGDLAVELNRILSYSQEPTPSRDLLAQELLDLAARL